MKEEDLKIKECKGMKEKEEGGGFACRSRERGAIEFLLDCLAKEVHFKIIKF